MNRCFRAGGYNRYVTTSLFRTFDPRALVIFYLCFVIAAMYVADVRVLAALTVTAFVIALLSRPTWRDVRRPLFSLIILITMFSAINLFFGRGWIFALTNALRLITLFLITVLIARGINPADFGVAFKGLGAPDKLAFALSLMMRFVPTLSRDFQISIDAQRARGFELDPGRGRLIDRARRYGPLLVPIIVRSVLDSEDVANAMDLRGFASRKRSWLRQLQFQTRDAILIAAGLLLLIALIALAVLGLNQIWTPLPA
jgi:energy-coupling factor transport system permease protein